MSLIKQFVRGDKAIWAIMICLYVISFVVGYTSMGQLAYKSGNYWGPISGHATYLFLAFIATVVVSQFKLKWFSMASTLFWPVSLILLVITLGIGTKVNGASRWLLGIQPSEVAKITLIGTTAFVLSIRERFTEKSLFYGIVIATAATCGLIVSENFSTALLLGTVILSMMIIGNISAKRIILLIAGIVLFVGVVIALCEAFPKQQEQYLDRYSTWRNRLISTDSNNGDEMDPAWLFNKQNAQKSYAKMAISEANLFVIGRGPGNSRQRDYLPQPYSDFVFAIIIEEYGFFGALLIMGLFFSLMLRIAYLAGQSQNPFARYMLYGCGLVIVLQALINLAVGSCLGPVTGQPLPLISRGGSSIVSTGIYFGIILSISHYDAVANGKVTQHHHEPHPLP